jgi:uncharacterized protein YjbI with pentapeptide repeats
MTNPTIKDRYTGRVLFEGEAGMTTREMLEKATIVKANLRYANLRYADLSSANLSSANLRYANLRYADLSSANLSSANLSSADLRYADLSSANLSSANLSSANLSSANLRYADLSSANLSSANLSSANLSYANLLYGKAIGSRPYLSIGPIGSRCDYAQLWITDKGSFVRAGCFNGTLDEFQAACIKTHGDTNYGKEYAMAVLMFESHSALWTPEKVEEVK